MSTTAVLVLAALGVGIFGATVIETFRRPDAELEDMQEEVGRIAAAEPAAWLRRESRRHTLWLGAGIGAGSVVGTYLNARWENQDSLVGLATIAICLGVGGIAADLVAGARMEPYSCGTVRSAGITPRQLSRYLTPRQNASNVVAVVMASTALAVAAVVHRVDGMEGGTVIGAASLVSLGLVGSGIAVQAWLVARPRASLTVDDRFWQEHLFVRRLTRLTRSSLLAGAAGVVVASGTVLTQDQPEWLRVLALLLLAGVGLAWFFTLDDARDADPEVLRELDASA